MNALKELLAALLTEGVIDDSVNGRIVEAYEFDAADYDEQLGGVNSQLAASQTAEGEANTLIAELTEKLAAAEAEIVNVKAMNFDKLMNGTSTVDDSDEGEEADPLDNPEITLDEIIDRATVEKD